MAVVAAIHWATASGRTKRLASLITALAVGAVVSTLEAIRAVRAERKQSRLTVAAQQAQAGEGRLRHEAEADKKKAPTESAKSR